MTAEHSGWWSDSEETQRRRRVFGAELRSLREKAGVTLSMLARHAKIDKAQLSRAENGRAGLSIAAINRLADELGASRFDLLILSGWLGVRDVNEETREALKVLIDRGLIEIR